MEYISTSSLANSLDLKPADLFEILQNLKWIERIGNKWALTTLGAQKGGIIKNNPKYGDYIVWPENITFENGKPKIQEKLINATAIGKIFNISSQKVNILLSEFGWIEKVVSGWGITNLGKVVGGKEFENETSGGTFVLWPETIIHNKNILALFEPTQSNNSTNNNTIHNTIEAEGLIQTSNLTNTNIANLDSIRGKYEAKHRTKDGHYVRSKAEAMIDNALYEYGLVHAYERRVPIEENLITDFYLPKDKVYIEYWGLENDPKYLERKNVKLDLYKKYEMKLIELNDEDIFSLDDYLPRKLLKFGIKVI